MKRTVLLMILVGSLVCISASTARAQTPCPPKPKDAAAAKHLAGKFWQNAVKLFDKKLYKQAMSAWICSNKMHSHPPSLFNVAKAAEKAREYSIAVKYYEAYLKVRPNAPEKSAFEDAPEGTPWQSDQADLYKDYNKFSTGAWVCMGLGVAVVATGAVLLVLGRKHRKKERFSIMPVPTQGGGMVTIGNRF